MFGGQWSSGTRDIYLICYMTSQDHGIERLYDFLGGSSSYVISLPCLVIM